MRYSVVCFDVGFTLLNEQTDIHTLISTVLTELGHEQQVERAAVLEGQAAAHRWYNLHYHRLDNDDWSSDATIHAFWMSYFERMFAVLDPSLDHRLVAERLIYHYNQPSMWQPYSDVLPTFEALQSLGVRIGIVSDWSSALRTILQRNNLMRWVDFAVVSADAGYAKPMRELYNLAVERAGVAPEAMIHIGDNYRADVLGARSVGMDAAVIDRARQLPRLDCPVLHDLRDVIPLIQD